MTTSTVTVKPSILSTLTTITTIGSTIDPIEQGGNLAGPFTPAERIASVPDGDDLSHTSVAKQLQRPRQLGSVIVDIGDQADPHSPLLMTA